ncbi:MAG: hypothetical protein O7C75_10615 [Verrucomicrobia bacterium]|nr:hypothetical protein [Verrucomicrobiota bacterium]
MSEQRLTYSEACKEVARHSAQKRKAIRRREAGKWIPARPVSPPPVHIEPIYNPGPAPEHHLEQTFLDFN